MNCDALGIALQDCNRVDRAGQPQGPADSVENVVGSHLAVVCHNDNTDAELSSEIAKPFARHIVRIVVALAGLLRWPNLFQHVNHDEGRFWDRTAPLSKAVNASLVEPGPFRRELQACRPRLRPRSKIFGEPPGKPPG